MEEHRKQLIPTVPVHPSSMTYFITKTLSSQYWKQKISSRSKQCRQKIGSLSKVHLFEFRTTFSITHVITSFLYEYSETRNDESNDTF